MILLQELFETPYFCIDQRHHHNALAAPFDGHPWLSRFAALARELQVVLPVSFFEQAGNTQFNSLAMIDADGSVLGDAALQRLVLDLHHDAQEMDVLAFNQQQMSRFSALLGFDSAVIASGTYLSTGRSAQECERIDSMHLHEASIEKMLARADMQVEDPALGLAKRTPGRAVAFSAHDGLFNDSASQAYYQAHGAKHTITCLTPVNRDGSVDVVGTEGARTVPAQRMAILDNRGDGVRLQGSAGSRALLIAGQPLNEPIAQYGPFVMNTREELMQAVEDYRAGRMGPLS